MSVGLKAPAWKQREIEHVARTLGEGVICRCGATLANVYDRCSAELANRCDGFEAIERAKASAPRDCRP